MSIESTAAANSSTAPTPATVAKDDGLGKNTFLRLLITQLQNQDPTQPKADGEFLAQLAQFSTLEQLQQMNATLERVAVALNVSTPSTGASPTTSIL